MQTFVTPEGKAGIDQVIAIQESVQSNIERMFQCIATRESIQYGVGRNAKAKSDFADQARLDARKRECDASITFFAGRALELSLHALYASGADRILGREYPDASKKEIEKERKTHSLYRLYQRICKDLNNRNIQVALDNGYKRALHKGIQEIVSQEDVCMYSILDSEDCPFRVKKIGRIVDGAEMTLDHLSNFSDLIFPQKNQSDFEKLSYETFEKFLLRSDEVYYASDFSDEDGNAQRKNMRWEHYSYRDHEYGRPYHVVGTKFFARLVQEVITLANESWTWSESFARRFFKRRQYVIKNKINQLIVQSFGKELDLPEMIGIEEEIRKSRSSNVVRSIPDHVLKSLHPVIRVYS